MATQVQTLKGVTAPSYNFTRPTDTTQYAVGDLIANNTAAASVVPLSWKVGTAEGNVASQGTKSFYVTGIRLHKSDKDITSAQFRVHLYKAIPTFTSAGDNGAFSTVVATGNANWLGSFDGTMVASHADGDSVICVPTEGLVAPQLIGGKDPSSEVVVWGLIEALATYTPASAEVFTAELLVEHN